jgi:hypothetical protein
MSSPGVGRLVGLRDSDDHDDIIDEGAAESVKELRRAAVWGDKNAQFSLGLCYHEGCGVTKNHVEAAWWFRRAAKQGHEVAETMISEVGDTSGSENSELRDEDSDGWEFLEDEEPSKEEYSRTTSAASQDQEAPWEMLNGEFGAIVDEWEERVIYAPEGRLYVTFVSSIAGPKLHKICSKFSPLYGQLLPGDVILSVDDDDVSKSSGVKLGQILRAKGDSTRRLTIRTTTARRMLFEASLTEDSARRAVSVGSVS